MSTQQSQRMRGFYFLGIDAIDAEMLQRPKQISRGNIPDPTARLAQSLAFRKAGLTPPQFLFGQLTFSDVPLESNQPAVRRRVHMILNPLSQRSEVKLIRDRYPFRHDSTKIFLVRHRRE